MTLPNFAIAGAPKSGTTALWAYLAEHPDVFLASQKEPAFFTQVVGEMENGMVGTGPTHTGRYSKGLEWYESLFHGYSGQSAVGEASTVYLSAPDAPELMLRHIPSARLIFVLRDPVDRAYSHYWQEYRRGWRLPPFTDMLRDHHPRLEYYRHVGAYAEHLSRFLRSFPRDRICVLLFEELRADPLGSLSRVCEFLGIDSSFQPEALRQRFKEQKRPRNRAAARLLSSMQASPVRDRVPPPLRSVLTTVGRRLIRWNLADNGYPPLSAELRMRVVGEFERDIEFVEQWTGHSLERWRR